jgi:hypothetical protein
MTRRERAVLGGTCGMPVAAAVFLVAYKWDPAWITDKETFVLTLVLPVTTGAVIGWYLPWPPRRGR